MTTRPLLKPTSAWLLAAVLSGLGPSAWAQDSATTPASPGTAQHPAHSNASGHPGHRNAPNHERMKTGHERRLQALKDKLQLSAEQEPAWRAFATAMAMPAGQPPSRPDPAELEKLSTPERIERMRASREQRQAEMNARMQGREEATKAFYASLKTEQKKIFDEETAKHMAQRGKHRHHG